MSSAAAVILLSAVLNTAAGSTADVSCHIHPPGSTPERPVGVIGPFDSVARCEQERVQRFGAGGRCHCAADFTPGWTPLRDYDPPGMSPLG